MKAVLDQTDETEVTVAEESKVRMWNANWMAFAQGPPLDEEEPTVEQLSALEYRVVVLDSSPYVDFAVFTPYNRRVSRANKFTAFIPQPDGNFILKEVPGPQNHTVWKYCWRTFRCASIQLGIPREAAIMAYYQNMDALVLEWPECWSLIYMADDKARAEGLQRKRRQFENSISLGQSPPALWDPASPWSACLLALAQDDNYWNKQVRNLAMSWMTRGKHGRPLTREQQITEASVTGGSSSKGTDPFTEVPGGAEIARTGNAGTPRPHGQGQSKSSRTKHRLQAMPMTPYYNNTKGGGKGKDKGKRKGKDKGGGKGGKITHAQDANGAQLCYSWNFGNGPCGALAPGTACPNGRVHACTTCLSTQHPARQHP